MTIVKRHLQVVDDTPSDALIKIAFATTDREHVDQHFGSARAFAIYVVGPDHSRLRSVSEFGDLSQDGNEDKLVTKLAMLEGCAAVYCRACGASAVRQLSAMGIQPVKVSEGALISELIEALRQELQEGPSSWLAKAIRRQHDSSDDARFDAMEAEGWDE